MVKKATIQTASLPERPIIRKSDWQARMVEACLEDAFLPDHATLVSFLVNALYLFGEHGIDAYGGAPEPVAAELTRLGHRLASRQPGSAKLKGLPMRKGLQLRKGPSASERAFSFGKGSQNRKGRVRPALVGRER